MSVTNDYSFDSIHTALQEDKESTVFFTSASEDFNEINLDTTLREQVSANTANIARHEMFISENEDILEKVNSLDKKIETFNNLSYVVHEDFTGNITNENNIDDLEKIVNDLRQIVYTLVRDYGTHLNTGDLKYQNQLATETLKELEDFISENQQNVLPIKEIITEVKDSRQTFYNKEDKKTLKERLEYDFSIITQRLQDLSEFEEIKILIQNMQQQINDIIENGVRQDIIDAIYEEIEEIKKDIEWLKENGGGGVKPDPTPETDLPDGNIIQQCLNVFLITNTTLFRMRSVVEENQGLIDYICFQISQGALSQEKVFECYPYLEAKIREKLIGTAIEVYSLKRESIDNMTTPQLVDAYSDDIIEETTTESIKKDFYDIDSIRNTFLSYGLPFFEEIPIRYQKNIVKNLNHLLKYKGTDKVLIDIIKLFGFSNTELFKYYLIKDIKRDDNGEPIIDYNDPKNSYELKFAQVSLDNDNITQALRDTALYQKYEEVVKDDPFWGDQELEEDFKNEILNMEFNYINTKYISINTVFDISKVNLETCHFFNMIDSLYNKGCLDTITFVSNNLKSSGNEVSLFNVITALNSLIYKRFGYEDIIHNSSTSIASIYSFNFNTDLDELYDIIREQTKIEINGNEIEFDISTLQESDIRDLSLSGEQLTREQLIQILFNNLDYKNYLITRMDKTTNYQEFKALESIFNYNMISESVNNLYDDYKTYSEYLRDNDYELYNFIQENTLDEESTLKTIDTILYNIETFLNSPNFDNIFSSLSNQTGNLIKNYIMKIIGLFKAYTIDLKKINFYFVMEDDVWGRIRMFSFLYKYTNMNKADSLTDYLDCIEKVTNIGRDIERSKAKDKLEVDEHYLLSVFLDITNKVKEYLFDKIKTEFNVDYLFCENPYLSDVNINMNTDVNNFINKIKVFERDRLFNTREYILINAKLGGGIFDDNYDALLDDENEYLYSKEYFE